MTSKIAARAHCRRFWARFLEDGTAVAALKQHLRTVLGDSGTERALIYVPLSDELDFRDCLPAGLECYAPRTLVDTMEFRRYQPARLEPGHHGVPGPAAECAPLVEPLGPRDLVLVPALGCTTSGVRLGRGGGYYDRWRERFAGARRLALLPDALTGLDFPGEAHDLVLDAVITEVGVKRPGPPATRSAGGGGGSLIENVVQNLDQGRQTG